MREENNSLKKALSVLDLFLKHEKLTIKEIMTETGYSKSAINRIMSSLESMHYVIRTKEDYQYSLGNKVYFLGERTDIYQNIVALCRDEVQWLSSESGFSVTLSIRENTKSVTIYKKESNSTMSLVPNVGERRSIHCSASGKVLYGYSEHKTPILEALTFESFTENTLLTKETFLKDVGHLYETGVAFDDEEFSPGLFCVAMPIFTPQKELLCSISLSGYKPKMLDNLDRLKALLATSITRIEKSMENQ